MKQVKTFVSAWLLGLALTAQAADVQTSGNRVIIRPDGGQAKVIQLEVINDNIIRVRATPKDELPVKPASLMIVPQQAPAKGSYSIEETSEQVSVIAKNVKAVVDKKTGHIEYFDSKGIELAKEVPERRKEDIPERDRFTEVLTGKQFWDYTVPERELGIKGGVQPTEEQKHGLTWQLTFDNPLGNRQFYGLGQHQSEEFNMRGKNEDLFQYNTKVSIPFVLSTDRLTKKCYGLLWDAYSYCRFGNPEDYLQLNRAFKLYDK